MYVGVYKHAHGVLDNKKYNQLEIFIREVGEQLNRDLHVTDIVHVCVMFWYVSVKVLFALMYTSYGIWFGVHAFAYGDPDTQIPSTNRTYQISGLVRKL